MSTLIRAALRTLHACIMHFCASSNSSTICHENKDSIVGNIKFFEAIFEPFEVVVYISFRALILFVSDCIDRI